MGEGVAQRMNAAVRRQAALISWTTAASIPTWASETTRVTLRKPATLRRRDAGKDMDPSFGMNCCATFMSA